MTRVNAATVSVAHSVAVSNIISSSPKLTKPNSFNKAAKVVKMRNESIVHNNP